MSRITKDIDRVADVLERGGIIGLPTETVYGLAALAEDREAVSRVFATKGRPTSHPLIVHLGTEVNVHEWGVFNQTAQLLADAFWPGPLTLLVPRTARVPDWVTGGRDTVAIRVPSHPVAQQLLNKIGTGVVAPSANRFGKVSPTTAQHVANDLGDDVDLILDGGSCEVGVESTIVECVDGDVRILRPGKISIAEILRVTTVSTTPDSNDPRAPGMLASHYAPHAEVRLYESFEIAAVSVSELRAKGLRVHLMHHENIDDFATTLYSELRDADSRGVQVVCAVLPPNEGVGAAIRDRLQKAAHR